MDEILVSDFMVFHDVIADRPYDLVIGDEAWEIDYFLHENPELKRFAYCWLTDFVGWLPMPEGGAAEAALTADYNAEMIEQIARYPRVRDLALFVGNPGDIVAGKFGDGLPLIREWLQDHYQFPSYVTGFDPQAVADRDQLRAELGYAPEEQVCGVTVGGSGVGGDLLRRLIDAYPHAASKVPGLRMLVVAGPRIDPATLPPQRGSRCVRTCPSYTGTWLPVTSPLSRAASPPAWSSPPPLGPSSTCRSGNTSSRPSTCTTACELTGPGRGWTSPKHNLTR
jgi:hypothetical protein